MELGLAVLHGVVVGGLAFWQLTFGLAGVFLLVSQTVFDLCPTMVRVSLRRVRLMVREYCDSHGIPYCEVPAVASYRAVARYLGEVSKAARL